MLVFVDESGDTGLKLGSGSSELFTLTLVIFESAEAAESVSHRIESLRSELRLSAGFEFHFKECSNHRRRAFLEAIAPFPFKAYSYVVNKAALYGDNFTDKSSFYIYVCKLLFENARVHLVNANVQIDESGDVAFKRELASYLKRHMNDPEAVMPCVKKVTCQNSKGNNLIQLADMVCGAIARSYQRDRSAPGSYRIIIAHRLVSICYWPEKV
jgi:hypothetical protein